MKCPWQRVTRSLGSSVYVALLLSLQLCVATAGENKVKRDLDAAYTPTTTAPAAAPSAQPTRDLDLPFSPPTSQIGAAPRTSAPEAPTSQIDLAPRSSAPEATRKSVVVEPPVVNQPPPAPLGSSVPSAKLTGQALAVPTPGVAGAAGAQADGETLERSYTLGSGDKIRMTIFGEEDLSGEFMVDGSGYVRLPLIGEEMASGRTTLELEAQIAARLRIRYLKNPSVSVEITKYRPFYIVGEVNNAGEYPFVAGMSVPNAIAIAGGYTFRARDSVVYVRRKGSKDEQEIPADHTAKVWPGDIIRVAERWF